MEFYCYSPSETFVVLTADQFVARDDGLLQQQRQDSTFVEKFYAVFQFFWEVIIFQKFCRIPLSN